MKKPTAWSGSARRPVDLMEDLGWLRDDAWFAHLVVLSDADIVKLGAAGSAWRTVRAPT